MAFSHERLMQSWGILARLAGVPEGGSRHQPPARQDDIEPLGE
jgi:hypothetical protein